MACGLPVVATAVGGTPDLVQGGVTGQLVPSDDVDAMAQAIWQTHTDPARSQRYGQAARARALQAFGLDAMVQLYAPLFAGQPPPTQAGNWPAKAA
jgi:glycosyltransferase involved in cell wall biosynthesis